MEEMMKRFNLLNKYLVPSIYLRFCVLFAKTIIKETHNRELVSACLFARVTGFITAASVFQ
jgi:hypothetical protein